MHSGPVFSVERLEFDSESGLVTKDVVRHPGAVTVIGELADGRLVMIRNERAAVQESLLEFCAGKLEPGEEPLEAASRELEEETGYAAASVRVLGRFYTSPGFADELMHVFLATNLTLVAQCLQPGESIEVELLMPSDVQAAIGSGALRDGKSIAAFHLWELARAREGTQE
jgi:ADP-ribose pyrophosphatase